jgi:serine/threonine protein kinase/tetratricopeptide (TPR) repeat protein
VTVPATIGRFRVLKTLGEGGMGVVYAAHDDRLDRPIAIKMMRASDAVARERLLREARAAAKLTHANICRLYEIGEADGELFIAMELLEGESLASRLSRGPMTVTEVAPIALSILDALSALHAAGLVHRDLKPSNVFLTPGGVKLLDFGLAREAVGLEAAGETRLTLPGVVVGTPQYMAPEQATGGDADARTDLFALGAILFETLAGRPAFTGGTMVDVLHAVMHEQPPVLTGSPAVSAVDRVVHRALAKRPDDRFHDAAEMARGLRQALAVADTGEVARARTVVRLIVLPFRMLRPDPNVDWLPFSLADAITSSLSGLETLVVRSSLAAARFAGGALDLKQIAVDAEVDAVVTGTLLSSGDRLRVSAQLVETPSGTVLRTETVEAALGDVFQVQDDLTRRIVETLKVPLSARDRRALDRDVPASPEAYEFYLRANKLAIDPQNWTMARELYLQAVERDASYAPAWARLGRIHRVLAKYGFVPDAADELRRAQAAFRRALELNPDLSIAHSLYTALEVEAGRAEASMTRLLERLLLRSDDPDLLTGLVLACRYCGLLDASVSAHEEARRLDPAVRSSVAHSFYLLGDYERAIATDIEEPAHVTFMALMHLGREDEARALSEQAIARAYNPHLTRVVQLVRAILTRDPALATEAARKAEAVGSAFYDPEGFYYWGISLAAAGDKTYALDLLSRAVAGGFAVDRAMVLEPWLDSVRGEPEFIRLLRVAEERRRKAEAAFAAAGGKHVLLMAARYGALDDLLQDMQGPNRREGS